MSDTNILPCSSGVYVITCLANNKIYVGSTNNFHRRRNDHFAELRRNKHHNQYLQAAWNKYGETNFVFEILEYVQPELCIEREQFWLNKLNPYSHANGFNIAQNAQTPALTLAVHEKMRKAAKQRAPMSEAAREKLRLKAKQMSPEHREKLLNSHLGKTISEDHRQRLIESNKTRIVSDETRQKIRDANIGKRHSDETKRKMSETHKRRFEQKANLNE